MPALPSRTNVGYGYPTPTAGDRGAAQQQVVDCLQVLGFQSAGTTAITTSRALVLADAGVVLVDASSGSVTLTLPGASTANNNLEYVIVRTDTAIANTLTVQRAGADTINGATSLTVPVGEVMTLKLPNGATDWKRVASVRPPAASQVEMETGTETAPREMSPQRVAQAVAALSSSKQIPTVSATVASNALTLSISPQTISFRSTTLGSGTITDISVGTTISAVVPLGATLGTTNAQQSEIAVLAINNAGTVEVACINLSSGVNLEEAGLISTTALSGSSNSSSTFYSTTARTNVAYRVLGIVQSTQATAGTWATAPSLIQGMGGRVIARVSKQDTVRVHTANGYGSTNTRIRRFTTVVTNIGANITYADSATNGATFTVNANGVYAMSFTDSFSAGGHMGISLNSNQLTTSLQSITAADRLCAAQPSGNNNATVAVTLYLPAGSVIRAHTEGGAVGSTNLSSFTISKVG